MGTIGMLSEIKQWIEDLDTVCPSTPGLEELSGKTVLITGATGLICSAIIDIFLRYNCLHKKNIKVIAAGRDINKIRKRFGSGLSEKQLTCLQYNALGNNTIPDNIDYIIHGACNANPNLIVNEPVETIFASIIGIKNLLDYCCSRKARILYISSSEVYGNRESSGLFQEREYGYIDILNSRNSYSIGKRAAETLCASYAKEYGVDPVIVRPGHIYGPTASPIDTRVASAWAYAAARGESIIMKSDGSQIRSYCYCLDCASAIITVLLKGESGNAYNIANPNSVISIREMAEILSSYSGVSLKIDVPTLEEKKGFNPMSDSSLNVDKLYSLGWSAQFDAVTGFTHTVDVLKRLIR